MSEERRERKVIPGVLWIALISLGLMVFGKVAFALVGHPIILIDAALSGALLVGLYLGHKWAYVLTIIFVAIGTARGFSKSISFGLAVIVLGCLVLVPILLCTGYYFRTEEPGRSG